MLTIDYSYYISNILTLMASGLVRMVGAGNGLGYDLTPGGFAPINPSTSPFIKTRPPDGAALMGTSAAPNSANPLISTYGSALALGARGVCHLNRSECE
jgi:hypothetical protein